MSNRGSDSDKLNPTHVSSSRAPLHLGHAGRPPHLHPAHAAALLDNQQDDDDKLLDVVGPPQSPLLPLSHSLQQMHAHQHSGKLSNSSSCSLSCVQWILATCLTGEISFFLFVLIPCNCLLVIRHLLLVTRYSARQPLLVTRYSYD